MFPVDKNFFQEGQVLIFYKPYFWTSFDLVKKIKKTLEKHINQKIKVGHAGTLDPLATGLIILCTGKATKKISEIQDLKKEYIATIELGKTTPSYDLETEFDSNHDYDNITREFIESVIKKFSGEIYQTPPVYSAKKYKGKRAYEYARKGMKLQLNPNKINIYESKILEFDPPYIKLKVLCSRGTYIRSLANDIGKALGCGAYLKKLERTRIGNYNIKNAFTVDRFEKKLANNPYKIS